MYMIIYRIYFMIRRLQKKVNFKYLQRAIDYIEAYYNLRVKKMYENDKRDLIGVTSVKRRQKIVVSLTSYPARIDTVWLTIETLLRQSMKPDELILWLADEQFPNKDSLPKKLVNQTKRGLQIKFCDKDLKSHKKYYYTMKEYPEDIVILADDDIFYPYDTIEQLMKMHKKFPLDVCACTTQVIDPSIDANPILWRNPNVDESIIHSSRVQVFTGSGSLFPPHSLSENFLDSDAIMKYCLFADDMWLTFNALANNTRITSFPKWRSFPVMIYNTSKTGLWNINFSEGQNDKQWTNLKTHYKNEFEIIKQNYYKG
ncbi:hypothetical protein [Catenibacterium mitsuokai]|uniref:hypothetical protein n=1 Tax=Catenibacterium mitsuokai TaxID=100886 RepID=UPI003F8CBC0C